MGRMELTIKEKIAMAFGTQRAFADSVGVSVMTVKRWSKVNEITINTTKGHKARKVLNEKLRKVIEEELPF